MSEKEKNSEGLLAQLLGGVIGVLIAAILIAFYFALRACFFWARQPLTKALGLEMLSTTWKRMSMVYRGMQLIAGIAFIVLLSSSCGEFSNTKLGLERYIVGSFYLSLSFLCGLGFVCIEWLREYASDPETQKKCAGIEAETYVQKIIDLNQSRFSGCQVLHGHVFVFKRDTPDEFSAEIDHLVITRKNVFVIETKYKSGSIFATVDAPTWKTSSPNGDGEMRNALNQAKNSARVMKNALDLPFDVIPLVAIYGKEVTVVGGPGNVVAAQEILKAMKAFEENVFGDRLTNPEDVMRGLLEWVDRSDAARQRHVERANARKVREDMETTVRTASIK
ncbi:MAG TPA: nuclease-related domain-containing protein [Noviherbaspirillum sp.]|nr:nuclease-related domain-containing protein [Noviherbaspirillum sp.]